MPLSKSYFFASHDIFRIQLIIFNLAGYKEAEIGEPNTISYLTSSESQYDFTGPTLSAPTSAPLRTANTDNFGSSQVSDTLPAKFELGYEPYVVGNKRSNFFGTDFGTIGRPDAAGNINPAPVAHDGSLYTQSPVDLSGSTSFYSRRSGNSVLPVVELAR